MSIPNQLSLFKVLLAGGLWMVTVGASAQIVPGLGPEIDRPRFQLNNIQFQVSAEQWVTTKTAKVTVGVDASLDQAGLDNLQAEVIANLNKLAKDNEWQITTYQRDQDQSGLEKVHIEAEARLGEAELASLRSKAKGLSKPGVKYSISDIDYEPSLSEIETVREVLRQSLYSDISSELATLNKIYPNQRYYVHEITFSSPSDIPTPQPMNRVNAMAADASMAKSANINRSNNLVMVADVTLSSTISGP